MSDHPSEITYADILRVGPGTLAGRYLRRFWNPVCMASEIEPGHVRPIRLMGEDLTLYRAEEGTAHVLADRCPHRGVQLRLGFVEGERLKCAYHGWTFDPLGQCVSQPAEARPFADRVRVRSYPTREYLGLVFVFLGEGEPPGLPRFPDYEDDELYVREITTETWEVSYFDLLENATDIAHTEFLHWHFRNRAPERGHWQESDFGMQGSFEGATGKDELFNRSYYHVPTAAEFAISGRTSADGYFTCAWRVPRDDNSAIRFNLFAFPRAKLEAAGYRPGDSAYSVLRGLRGSADPERDASESRRSSARVETVARGLLEGAEDMRALKERSAQINFRYLTNLQDCAVLMSLGPPAERRFGEQLGSTDASIALMRRIWIRELKALAEGKPLKEWKRPDYLWPDVTALHRAAATANVTANVTAK